MYLKGSVKTPIKRGVDILSVSSTIITTIDKVSLQKPVIMAALPINAYILVMQVSK